MSKNTETRELRPDEIVIVGGGNVMQELQDRFPLGEWHNGSFYPNGYPRDNTPPNTTF